MSSDLQTRILTTLSEQGTIPAKEIGRWFPEIDRGGLDCGLGALVRSAKIALSGGVYSLPGRKLQAVVLSAAPPPALKRENPVQDQARICRQCREPKALDEYPLIGPQKRRGKTCNACREEKRAQTAAATNVTPQQQTPTISNHVFELARARRQEALNRISVLKVDVANQEALVAECDQFISLYERFAEGAQ